MNLEVLQSILLEDFDAQKKGDSIEIPANRRITILLTFGDDVIRVTKVRSIRVTKTHVALVGESESLYVDSAHDFAIKSEDQERREDRPGFH